MSEYVVLFPADDEAKWLAGSPAEHQATFDTDGEFARRLAARGGSITGGAGLGPSGSARTLRHGVGSGALVTDGPFAETVEQLSGFFLVRCDSFDDLVEAAEVLLDAHPVVEIRPVDES